MEGLLIAYDFKFTLVVKKRNGRTFQRHLAAGIGRDFNGALWDVYFKLKKRKCEILKVNRVEPIRIAFAFKGSESLRLKLADYPPALPEDLEDALKYLPKK
ncbi:hypothetical protein SAMN06265348_10645 [Pedobacter westerhofensis]|uniref:Uncharacterized protein n=1 Tax=Pedobacter westerhofensis TaxID=425512 RepID=A0A521DP34_9SPHI|nr:hypothetical protein [Pedobacter westerhofensis]SMO73335.1 hypothetical protein SAMN06265348_10645 [Pedobacter westerhofensis]